MFKISINVRINAVIQCKRAVTFSVSKIVMNEESIFLEMPIYEIRDKQENQESSNSSETL